MPLTSRLAPKLASKLAPRKPKMGKRRMQRRPELDALRGLFLVWMTLTHLPTQFSALVNQPFGFLSSAEGFVFLSALLVAQIYVHQAEQDGRVARGRLWKRALQIYGYHLIMLALAFTVAAAYALHMHRTALTNLLDFYLAHPLTAILGSVLLIYCPPLLDILPMYVIFLALTPYLLDVAARRGWRLLLIASGTLWLLAQFGLRAWVHGWVVRITGLHIPLQEAGAFNLFAWQAVWIFALALGAQLAKDRNPFSKLPGYVFAAGGAVCLFFLGVRHDWLGPHLTPQTLGMSLDKWQLGPLRVLNLFAFACLIYWFRETLSRIVMFEPLLTLGKASLEVFCAHLFFVFIGLALLYGEVTELHGTSGAILVAITLAGLTIVAAREVRRKRLERQRKSEGGDPVAA